MYLGVVNVYMCVPLLLQAIEAAATLYDDYCRVITPENLLTEESEEVGHFACSGATRAHQLA
jgi:hypothetical protein